MKNLFATAGAALIAVGCTGLKVADEVYFDARLDLPPFVAVPAPTPVDPAIKTPQTSALFERRVDPKSGVPFYVLKTKLLAYNQQSVYFTHKSMTDDGRFIVFWCSDDEFEGPGERVKGGKGERGKAKRRKSKWLGLVDFKTDQLHSYEDCHPWIPFLDTKTDVMYYVTDDGFFRRDLLVDPAKEIKICDLPAALKAEGRKIKMICTHLTLTADRTHAFLESRVDDKFVQGMVDLRDGSYEKWGEADIFINHGQINPVDDTLALCAFEGHWKDAKGVQHDIPRPTKENPNVVYPRLQLLGKGWRRMIPSKKTNYATHERWDEQGEGFYWCSGGVYYHDLATGRQTQISPVGTHAMMSADRRYVVSDHSVNGWWRGSAWETHFWNRETGKGVKMNSFIERYTPRERPSKLHPDPHPQFVCCDRYMIWTLNSPDSHMDLAIAATDEVAAFTK